MADNEWEDIDQAQEQSNMPTGRQWAKTFTEALPVAGAAAGGFFGSVAGPLGTIGGAGLGAGAGKALENIIESQFLDEQKTTPQIFTEPIQAIAEGAASEMGGQVLTKGLTAGLKGVSNLAQKSGKSLEQSAAQMAERATGATGAQAAKFKEGAGRELLDRGLIKFGDAPSDVATRLSGEMDKATQILDDSLKALDDKGVQVSVDNVVAELQKKANSLKADPSQASIVKKLEGIIDDIINTGESNIPVTLAEKTKRGFNKMAGNWMNPEVGQAGKEAYRAYKGEVEKTAQKFAPDIAEQFKSAKETYGLLAPIEEAAQRRALTLQQSPIGGLLDVATTITSPNAALGVAAAAGRREIAPRIASSAAVTMDKASKLLLKNPNFANIAEKNPQMFQQFISRLTQTAIKDNGPQEQVEQKPIYNKDRIFEKTQGSKYSQALQKAAENGDQSFNAAHYVLYSNNENYRKLLEDEEQ